MNKLEKEKIAYDYKGVGICMAIWSLHNNHSGWEEEYKVCEGYLTGKWCDEE